MTAVAGQPSFDEFYADAAARLIRHGYALTGDMAEAQDIAQEAFARLMRKGALDADPAPYLRAIVCNLTRNRHRHLRVVRAKTLRAVSEPSSEQAAILREDHAEVIAALAALPARRREAIVLRFWLGLSEREIATTMGVSPGTVKSQLSRGLAALARALEARA